MQKEKDKLDPPLTMDPTLPDSPVSPDADEVANVSGVRDAPLPAVPAILAAQKYETPANFREWSNLLGAIPLSWRPGKINSMVQPDVELLVMMLKDVPLTAEKFSEMSSGRDWVTFNFVVLAVGPPGFSNVPFTAGPKKMNVETKTLYDLDEHANTRFYPFEKGATNRDRGERVSQMMVAGTDVLIDATTVLETGTCISLFLRQEGMEMMKEPVMHAPLEAGALGAPAVCKAPDTVPANSLMAIVLSSNNISQTAAGRGLKLKKARKVASSCMLSVFSGMPQGEERADEVMMRTKAQATICNLVVKDNIKVFGCVADPLAHATTDTESDALVLCNMSPGLPEVFFSWAQLDSMFGVEKSTALKLVNIAIATKALRVVVVRDDRPSSDISKNVLTVGCMTVDWNEMLNMHIINGLAEWPCAHESWGHPCSEEGIVKARVTFCGTVLWTCPLLPLTTTGKRNIYWALKLHDDKAVAKESMSQHFLTEESKDQGGHSLDLFLAPQNVSFEDVFAELQASDMSGKSTAHLRHQMRLRFKPERKGGTCRKKRSAIQWDE